MKLTAETKLLLVMGVFVLLGGGFLAFSNRIGSGAEGPAQPGASPKPIPTPSVTRATFDQLVKNGRHVKDAPNAKFTIVEFADFQCPSCRNAYANATSRFGKDIPARLIFYHFPLVRIHENAMPAAIAAEAASKQGKFWQMYDALFTGDDARLSGADIDQQATNLGLNLPKFHADEQDPAVAGLVTADQNLAQQLNIEETPTFLIVPNADKTAAPIIEVGAAGIKGALPYLLGKGPLPPSGTPASPASAAGPPPASVAAPTAAH